MKPSQAHNNESKFLMTVSSTGLSLAKRSKAPSLVAASWKCISVRYPFTRARISTKPIAANWPVNSSHSTISLCGGALTVTAGGADVCAKAMSATPAHAKITVGKAECDYPAPDASQRRWPQFPIGIVSSVSFVSTTNTARSLAGCVSLALALTLWRSPGNSEKLCPAL
jgi:hypothetical protein